jgi:excinuclease UvrABC ATPase subunit
VHKNGGLFPAAVLATEHNLDMIKSADYIIYLDPEGGNEGDG